MQAAFINRCWMLTVVALGVGCAHRPPEVAASRPAEVVVPAAPLQNPVPVPSQKEQDLAALLKGTVIHFDSDEALLAPESRKRLQDLAEGLRGHPTVHIRISGNCDDRGTSEYNLALGDKRAVVAKTYLVNLGISAARVDTVSYGEEKPVDVANSDAARAANRRDDFVPTAGI
jgi:peptidoglycan-associated lipoprotein